MENNLIKIDSQLPVNLDDLSKFVLIGKEKLVSVKAEIRAMKNLKIAEEVYKQKEVEAKELGGALLLAKVRIGEMLKEIPKDTKFKGNQHTEVTAPHGANTKTYKLEEMGITKKVKENCEKLAENKEIVEDVIENSEDIPTQTECLKKIAEHKKEEKRRDIVNKMTESNIQSESIDIYNTENKYKVIYADPPWSYGNKMPEYVTEPQDHYKLMKLEDICNMPIKNITEDDAVLFLWVVVPQLEEALKVIKSWGFKYKTHFIWDKVKHNMGHYTSVRHELLFICTKGKCMPDNIKLFDSVYSEERTQHSVKPEYFRKIIDTLYIGTKLELFSRKKAEGWDYFGNELI
jgi:site-specific DNA-methyltransferase (adenine-specific)